MAYPPALIINQYVNKAARDYQRWRWKLRCAVTRGFSFSRFLISKKTLTCRQSVLPCACYKNDISLSGFKHGSHAGLFPGYAAARRVNTEQRTSSSAEPLRLDSLFLRAAITSQGVCVCASVRVRAQPDRDSLAAVFTAKHYTDGSFCSGWLCAPWGSPLWKVRQLSPLQPGRIIGSPVTAC